MSQLDQPSAFSKAHPPGMAPPGRSTAARHQQQNQQQQTQQGRRDAAMSVTAPSARRGSGSGAVGLVSGGSMLLAREMTTGSWAWRDVDWAFVFGGQHYGGVALLLLPCVAVAASLRGLDVDPRNKYFDIDDPSLRHPPKEASISAGAAIGVPLMLFVLVLATGEFWLYRPLHGCLSNALHATLHVLLGWGGAMAAASLVWSVTTIVVGRQRPDFVSRCDKDGIGECTTEPHRGRESFFSGRTALATVSAAFSSVYILWLVYFRITKQLPAFAVLPRAAQRKALKIQHSLARRARNGQNAMDRLIHEIGHAAAIYVILIQLGFAWATGISTIVDNRNHVSDINSALLLGGSLGVLFALNSIWMLDRAPKKDLIIVAPTASVPNMRSAGSETMLAQPPASRPSQRSSSPLPGRGSKRSISSQLPVTVEIV